MSILMYKINKLNKTTILTQKSMGVFGPEYGSISECVQNLNQIDE